MRMLKNLSIAARLAGGFGVLVALLALNAMVGVLANHSLFANAHRTISTDVELAKASAAISVLILNERRFEKDVFINIADDSSRTAYKAKWDAARAALTARIVAAGTLDLAATDKETLAGIDQAFRTYVDGFEHVYARIISGEIKTTQAANDELSAVKTAVHTMDDTAQRLDEVAVGRVNRAGESLAATNRRSSVTQISIALACLGFGAAMCVVTIRSITIPLRRSIDIARAVAQGNLDNVIELGGRDETGQLLSSLKIMQDALLENQLNAKGQIIAISKSTAVAEFDLDGALLAANDHYLKIFDYSRPDLEGRHHSVLVEPGLRSSADYREFWATLRRGEHIAGQYRRMTRDGREVFLQSSFNPIPGVDGRSYKIVEHATDVTHQVKLQRDQAAMQTNQLRLKEALDRAVGETQSVAQAAIDGELTRRIDLAGKDGQVAALAGGVNSLIEAMAQMVTEIKRAAGEVHLGAREISSGNTNLSQRTEQQAASLEETAASMEELTGTVKTTALNAAEAERLAVIARTEAARGTAIVTSVIDSMNRISAASKKISDIIGVIDGIAFQTNLLALNAAVEAARAGEQGRGFAVVASEVRTLASRSATAAQEIKALIGDSVTRVDEGSIRVGDSGKALDDIGAAIQRLATVVAEIAAASQTQASSIEEVNKAIMQLDETTQQNAALVEEAAATSESIVGQADTLSALVARWKVGDVSAARGRAAACPARRACS